MVTMSELWEAVSDLNRTYFRNMIRITDIRWIHERNSGALAYYSGDCFGGEILLIEERLGSCNIRELRHILYHEMGHQVVLEHNEDFRRLMHNYEDGPEAYHLHDRVKVLLDAHEGKLKAFHEETAVRNASDTNSIIKGIEKTLEFIGYGAVLAGVALLFSMTLGLISGIVGCFGHSGPAWSSFKYPALILAADLFTIACIYVVEEKVLPRMVKWYVMDRKGAQ